MPERRKRRCLNPTSRGSPSLAAREVDTARRAQPVPESRAWHLPLCVPRKPPASRAAPRRAVAGDGGSRKIREQLSSRRPERLSEIFQGPKQAALHPGLHVQAGMGMEAPWTPASSGLRLTCFKEKLGGLATAVEARRGVWGCRSPGGLHAPLLVFEQNWNQPLPAARSRVCAGWGLILSLLVTGRGATSSFPRDPEPAAGCAWPWAPLRASRYPRGPRSLSSAGLASDFCSPMTLTAPLCLGIFTENTFRNVNSWGQRESPVGCAHALPG